MTHLLDKARGQMREGHTSAQWELIAREKVMRTLLETGEFTADDLADLNIPVEYRRHVHGAATGHFSGAQPFMEFVTRRKSERPSRKGGKNDVFRITAKGRRELPRLLRDLQTELTLIGSSSTALQGVGNAAAAGSGENHSEHSEGKRSVSPADSLDRPDGSLELPSDGAESIAVASAGIPPRSESAAIHPPAVQEVAAGTGSPARLSFDEARHPTPSAYDPWAA